MAAGLLIQDMQAGAGRSFTAGEAIGRGEMVALNAAGLAFVANAIVGATQQTPCVGMAIHDAAITEEVQVAWLGEVEDVDATFTEGAPLYLAETDGNVTETPPATTNDWIQIVGMTLTTTIWRLHIDPLGALSP